MDHHRGRPKRDDSAFANGILVISPGVILKNYSGLFPNFINSISHQGIDMKNQVNGIDKQLLNKILRQAKTPAQPEAKPLATVATKPPQPQSDEPRDPPVHTITTGAVVTRIWGRANVLGHVSWSVDQRRYRSDGVGGAACKSFYPDQLTDAVEGLNQARKWIKKTDRRVNRRRLWS